MARTRGEILAMPLSSLCKEGPTGGSAGVSLAPVVPCTGRQEFLDFCALVSWFNPILKFSSTRQSHTKEREK